jgi:ribosomal protein L3 glutamine methyltransferase
MHRTETDSNLPRDVAALVGLAERRLTAAGVVCAQGSATYRDEAAFIVYHALGLHHDDPNAYERRVEGIEIQRVEQLIGTRIASRMPAAYLLGEAWFAGLAFDVNPSVLIPRSPFAELIGNRFAPWFAGTPAPRILEIGTGSGCIAVACALAFPRSTVVATDLSWPALQVARRNILRHGVDDQVTLVRADLLRGIQGRFDLLITNPPYVPDGDLDDSPPEFAWEPRQALAGGKDGLVLVRQILQDSARHLTPEGLLAIEVGGGAAALEAAFPDVPFIWPELAAGGDGIAVVSAAGLSNPGGLTRVSARP